MSEKRKGCLVALVIVGVSVFVCSLILHFYVMPKLRELASSNLAFELDRRIEAYHREFGEWPAGDATDILLSLRGDNPGELVFVTPDFPVRQNRLVDAWQNPYHFRFEADGRPVAVSPGRNGVMGDGDDIDGSLAREKAESRFPDGIPDFEPVRPGDGVATDAHSNG